MRLLVMAVLATAPAIAVSAQEPQKDTKKESKYLDLVEAEKAFEVAKKTGKRIFVYQDWPL